MRFVVLPREIKQAIQDHGRSQRVEVCGLLGGIYTDQIPGAGGWTGEPVDKDSVIIDTFIPVQNIAKHPASLAVMEPKAMMVGINALFAQKKHYAGWMHSHPFNLGVPSGRDVEEIKDDVHWLIWGGQDQVIRSWFPVQNGDRKTFVPTVLIEG